MIKYILNNSTSGQITRQKCYKEAKLIFESIMDFATISFIFGILIVLLDINF